MVRLIIKAQTAQEVVLAVHGNIAGSTVPLLKQAGEAHWHESQRLVLDLDEVPFIDETRRPWWDATGFSRSKIPAT